MSDFPTVEELLAIHSDQIRNYGGSFGIRDRGLLESALNRPQQGYYRDIIEEAAALWESLAQNHPFVDGNKRVALAATDTFLEINGLAIQVDDEAVFAFIDGLYRNSVFDFEHLEAWLRSNTAEM
jgi:death-on-curing protein